MQRPQQVSTIEKIHPVTKASQVPSLAHQLQRHAVLMGIIQLVIFLLCLLATWGAARNLDATAPLAFLLVVLVSQQAIAWFLQRQMAARMQRQLDMMKEAMRRFEADDLDARVPTLSFLELQQMGQTFNHLAHRDQQQQELIQQKTQEVLTYRQRVEQAIIQSRAIFNATTEAMLLLGPDGQLLELNAHFAEWFLLDAVEIMHAPFEAFMQQMAAPCTDPSAVEKLFGLSSREHELPFDESLILQKPVLRELFVHAIPIYCTEKKYLGRLYILQDVTKERENERLKNEFASLSHELRSPLTSIKGFVELLLEGGGGENSAIQHEFLSIVQKSADGIVTLVDNLLDILRIEAGTITLQLVPISLMPLFKEVIQSFAPQLTAKEHHLVLEIPEDLPLVLADASGLRMVVNNLLSNACKYTLPGGTVSIIVDQKLDTVRVTVRDNGVGMTKEEQARLFTKFFRAKNSLTEKEEGTGLGLVISHSLVELHGSSLQVESVPGQGSTFFFHLAQAQGAAQSPKLSPTTVDPQIPVRRRGDLLQ